MAQLRFRRLARRRMAALLAAVTLTVYLAVAPAALATVSVHWFTGNLPPGEGYASSEAHSITFILADADHNVFCIGREQGWGGWYYVGGSHYVSDACAYPGDGGHAEIYYDGACCYHATIENHSTDLTDYVYTSTHYDYP